MLPLLPVLLLTLASQSTCQIVLKDNGYENIVIAIGESVPESGRLLAEIEQAFTKASAYLYTATRRRAYFRDVTILVPESWSSQSFYKQLGGETFANANIRIDLPAVPGEDTAYVLSRGSVCGMEGEYMHITPDRLTEYQDISPAERMIVHEWAHLRWGVFDEYGIGSDVAYLSDEGTTEGTGCAVELSKKGKVVDSDGNPCSAFSLSSSCRLQTNPSFRTRGSIMFRQYIDSVDRFCNDGDDESLKHNRAAPNFQNRFCSYRSTWDVITSHNDFSNNANKAGSTDQDTKPTFRYVHSGSRFENFVFVLDLSLSMKIDDKMDRLRQAAHLYIATATPGTRIGIVTLQTRGTIRLPLRALWNATDRRTLSQALPTTDEAAGNTGIGSGLLKGLEVLTGLSDVDANTDVERIPFVGGSLIVMSDGEENETPLISSAAPLLKAAGVTVHTIGLGPFASQRLGVLSEDSSGMVFYADNDGKEADTQMLNEALMTLSDQSSRSTVDPLMQVASDVHVIRPNESDHHRFMIDAGIGQSTEFFVMWNASVTKDKHAIQARLISPSGRVTSSLNTSMYTLNKEFSSIQISLPSTAESGWWEYEISNPSISSAVQAVTVSVSSRRTSSKQSTMAMASLPPLTVKTFVSATTVQYPQAVLITARVMMGYRAVVRANVIAEISRPNATRTSITLKDNGIAPDMYANDGVYGAYFSDYSINGRYNVIVRASSDDDTASAVGVRHLDDIAMMSDDELEGRLPNVVRRGEQLEPRKLSAFVRVRAAGAFQLENYDGKTDRMAPAKVMDLRVVVASLVNAAVTIQWSAPGDNSYTGKVASYDVRVSRNFTRLLDKFSSAPQVGSSDVVSGSLTPLPAGEQQEVTFTVYNGTWPYFVAITSKDEAGNPSEVSNIAQFMLTASVTSGSETLSISLFILVVSGLIMRL